jgi:putative two-component system hydrogenase maturation factor HypX/HoxX
MKQADRKIDWETDVTETIVRKIHAADGFPGVRDQICNRDYLLFGAHFEDILGHDSVASPGDIIATRHGAICRKTVECAVWISHLKRKGEGGNVFKLPATTVLPDEILACAPDSPIPTLFTGMMSVGNDWCMMIGVRVDH